MTSLDVLIVILLAVLFCGVADMVDFGLDWAAAWLRSWR